MYSNWDMYGIGSVAKYHRYFVEDYPEFWEKIVEQDYEILKFKNTADQILCERISFKIFEMYKNKI
jgi:hypothetical protein